MEIKILTKDEVVEALKKLNGWSLNEEENKISKEFKFEGFLDALKFINQMSGSFEERDHHPDIHIFYNKIKFDLQRFDVGGKVTDLDITTASEIDAAYSKINA